MLQRATTKIKKTNLVSRTSTCDSKSDGSTITNMTVEVFDQHSGVVEALFRIAKNKGLIIYIKNCFFCKYISKAVFYIFHMYSVFPWSKLLRYEASSKNEQKTTSVFFLDATRRGHPQKKTKCNCGFLIRSKRLLHSSPPSEKSPDFS